MTAITVRTKISRCYAGQREDGLPIICAETRRGRRFTLMHVFSTIEGAQRRAAAVIERGSIDPALWDEIDTIYGSEAWTVMQAEAQPYAIGMREGYIADISQVPEALRAYL